MKLLKKGSIFLLLVLLGITTSCEDNNEVSPITGLDFTIATVSADGTKVGVVPTTAFGNGNVVYTIDFGAIDNSDSDVFQTSAPMVTYSYPKETKEYVITVTASLEGAIDVSINKTHTVTYVVAPPAGTGNTSPLAGVWKMAPEAAAFGVGPELGNVSWFANSSEDVTTRACFFDDEYIFSNDGTFQNNLGADTWVEAWQGATADGCAASVAPHNGSKSGSFVYNQAAGTLTIEGKGSFLGLPKVVNGAELANPGDAPDSVTYDAALDGDTLTLDINFGSGFWRFKLIRASAPPSSPLVGTWKMAKKAGAFGVGPALGDLSWFANSSDDITTRACFFDDEYVFNNDGTFKNVLGADTWVETWQGAATDGCAPAVFPHDGSEPATYSFVESTGKLTLDGKGAFLGLAKVVNGAELASPGAAPDSVTYDATLDGNTITLDINFGSGFWRFILEKQ